MTQDDEAPEHDFPRTSQPALRALLGAGYTRLDQLTAVTERELLALHGMGPKALRILRDALAAQGKSFAAKPQSESRKPIADSR